PPLRGLSDGFRRNRPESRGVGAEGDRASGRKPLRRFGARKASNPAAAAETLERAGLAVALRTFLRQADVPDFSTQVACAFIQVPVQDEPGPHARPESEK